MLRSHFGQKLDILPHGIHLLLASSTEWFLEWTPTVCLGWIISTRIYLIHLLWHIYQMVSCSGCFKFWKLEVDWFKHVIVWKKNIITLSHIHTEKERDENLCSHPLLHSPNVCNDQDLTISSLLEEPEAAQSECGK